MTDEAKRLLIDYLNRQRFIEHLERASETVAGWPDWKRKILVKWESKDDC
jgi:hypothetical protein